ncbi:hypothetical protein SCFA_450047 [anaerobic digester metagenome]|uniref:Uncharacterized protein n=1 Tax=anaerobic digester metagenome TaxID=1263854 RepID=A0A485M1Z5_9ZZZZ
MPRDYGYFVALYHFSWLFSLSRVMNQVYHARTEDCRADVRGFD